MSKNNLFIILFISILFTIIIYLIYQVNILQHQNKLIVSIPVPTPTIPPSPLPIKPSIIPTSNSIPTPSIKINRAKILDTSSWISYSCGRISYKLPSDYSHKCVDNIDGSKDVVFGSGNYVANYITVRNYDGGSRRQYWINDMKVTTSEISKYVRFQETMFGSVSGLDVFASGGWWQGGYASPILISSGKTIISIYGGRNFDDQTGEITRWDITDTIASTIKFN